MVVMCSPPLSPNGLFHITAHAQTDGEVMATKQTCWRDVDKMSRSGGEKNRKHRVKLGFFNLKNA